MTIEMNLLERLFPRRLQLQAGVIVSLLLVATIALYTWHTIRVQSRDATTAIQRQVTVMAKNISDLSINYLLTEDLALMEALLKRIAAFPNIVSIVICDREGTIFSQVVQDEHGEHRVVYDPVPLSPPHGSNAVAEIQDTILVVWHPIEEGSLVGWVRIEYSLLTLTVLQKRIWRDSFIAGVLVVSLSIVLILLFLHPHIKEVRWITEFARTMDEHRGEKIAVKGSSFEIRQLVNALNDTSMKLFKQDRSIKVSAANLERLRRHNLLILQSAGEGILGLDLVGKHTFVNSSAARMLGYEMGELIGQPIYKICQRRSADASAAGNKDCPIYAALEGQEVQRMDYEVFWRKNGSNFPVEYTVTPIKEDGRMTGAVVTFRDITERKHSEEALRESERKYRNLFEESKDVILIDTPDGRILDVNPAGVALLGYASKEQLLQVNIGHDLFVTPQDREIFKETVERQGFIKDYEIKLKRKEGDILNALVTATAVYDDKGTIAAYRGMFRDVTAERKLENQLRHAQKMEAIGQLAGGVAHDFNNILTAIIGYGNLLRMKMNKEDPMTHTVDQILSSSDRAAQLTQSLLAFSRRQMINPKPISISDLITNVEKLLSRLIGEDIELTTSLADEAMTIMADAGQVEQVLINLATNARDAMPDGGKLVIETRRFELTGEFTAIHGYGDPGFYACISVSDTGKGMDESTIKKVFEPFYTTKEVGKGTGLGLSLVYGIIKQHNGYINVQSETEKGTNFSLYFPLIKPEAVTARHEERERYVGGMETILLAEDDNEVRNLSKFVLEEFGYSVIEAENGEEALDKFAEHQKDIQLLILDVIMPRKNGKEVYEEIKKTKPQIKALFTSGYSTDMLSKKGILGKDLPFLSKPVSPKDFLKKIREVLND